MCQAFKEVLFMAVLKLLNPVGALVSFIRYKTDRLRLHKLIKRGMKVGKNVYINEKVEFDLNYPYLIDIGDNCRISIGVRILAHDATTFRELGVTRIAPVKILDGTFIGERAIILPGVTLGPNAMVAAGSVVNRDVPEGKAVAGNPARAYYNYSDIIMKYIEIIKSGIVFDKTLIENEKITREDIIKALEANNIAFIKGVPRDDPYYINADYKQLRKEAIQAYKRIK